MSSRNKLRRHISCYDAFIYLHSVSNSVENQEVIARWPLGSTLPRKNEKNSIANNISSTIQGAEGDDMEAALQNPFPSKNSRKAREKLLSKLRIVGSNVPIIAAQHRTDIEEGDDLNGGDSNLLDEGSNATEESSSSSSTIR